MNKETIYTVTLLEDRYGTDIHLADISWKDIIKRVTDPPFAKDKGTKGAVIAGRCEWEEQIHKVPKTEKTPLFDGDGNPILNSYGRQKMQEETVWVDDIRNGRQIMCPKPNTRNVINRSLVLLDCDNIENVDKFFETLYELFNSWGWAFALYTTFSATKEHPKYRIIIPLSEPVSPENYTRIVNALMYNLDAENCDPCSATPNQMMFLPVWPKKYNSKTRTNESQYYDYIIKDDGEPIDVKCFLSYLDVFNDDEYYVRPIRNSKGQSINRLTKDIRERKAKEADEKAKHVSLQKEPDFDIYPEKDPRNKNNLIGAFCRAYSISEAIELFDLPYDYIREGVYKYQGNIDPEDGLRHGTKSPPGAYIARETADISYDTLLVSWHTTDPAYGAYRNAWDLVLIHNFNNNYRKMCIFARKKLDLWDPDDFGSAVDKARELYGDD